MISLTSTRKSSKYKFAAQLFATNRKVHLSFSSIAVRFLGGQIALQVFLSDLQRTQLLDLLSQPDKFGAIDLRFLKRFCRPKRMLGALSMRPHFSCLHRLNNPIVPSNSM